MFLSTVVYGFAGKETIGESQQERE